MKYTHNTHDPNLESTTKTATLFNDLLTRRFAQTVLGNILYILYSSFIILCMDNVCFFMSTRVSMFIFIFIFHPPTGATGTTLLVQRGD